MHKKLEEFENSLKSQDLVNDNHLPYVVWWVKHYLDLYHPDEASCSDVLGNEGKHDWQIFQILPCRNDYGKGFHVPSSGQPLSIRSFSLSASASIGILICSRESLSRTVTILSSSESKS